MAICLAAAGLQIQAQTPPPADTKPPVSIQGVVLDQDSRLPVGGARITAVSIRPGSSVVAQASTATADGNGRFEVRANGGQTLSIHAQAMGYANDIQGRSLTVPENQQSVYVELMLTRLGSVTGVLVDDESRKPLAGLRVAAVPRDTSPVTMGPAFTGGAALSQSDGSFILKDIPAAEFFVRISADPAVSIETIPAKDLAADTRDKALEVAEGPLSYGVVYWPGRFADLPQTSGLKVIGGVLDLGEIRLERHKLQSLSGVLNGCDRGVSMQLLLAPPTLRDKTVDHDLVCSEGFRILNLPGSTFTFSAVQGGPPRRFAFQAITAATRGPLAFNMAAAMTVHIEVELEGVAREDFPQDLKDLRVELQPESAPVRISSPTKTLSGAFEADLFPGLRYQISMRVPPKYYLKQLSYNGLRSSDVAGFTAYGGLLRLILSDRAGRLEAKVVASGASNFVVAVREGMSYADVMGQNLGSLRQLPVPGTDGMATLQGLMPGLYRVFISPTFTPSRDSFEDSLRNAASVTVEEGQTATITLRAP